MIDLEDHCSLAREIESAHRAGAQLREACAVARIEVHTLQRRRDADGLERGDHRPCAVRPTPAHALSPEEREQLPRVANEPRFADLTPARIVPTLANQGVYLASESSFQRVLRTRRQTRHRGRAKAAPPSAGNPRGERHSPGTVVGHD